MTSSNWAPYGVELQSRFLLGTAGYPSPQILADSILASGTTVQAVADGKHAAAAIHAHLLADREVQHG